MTSLFTHIHVDNKAAKTLFLLHGTGGDESDFLFLDNLLHKKYNLVGLRGNVREDGMNRFFRRLEPGIFDQDSIRAEAEKLDAFIASWLSTHAIDEKDAACLGYSNGANMLLATLFLHPAHIKKALLLHPMMPMNPTIGLDLSQKSVFVSFGTQDAMVASLESKRVIDTLTSLGADVKVKEYPTGHAIGQPELEDVIGYLRSSSQHISY